MKQKQNLLPAVFLFLFLLLGASVATYLFQQPPDPLPASIPAAEFSAERAFRHVEALPDAPRPVCTAAHLRTRDYILSELHALGLSPQIQETTIVDPQLPVYPGMIFAGTVQNVIARLPGTVGNQAILLACHTDEGVDQHYNVQVAADQDSLLIVAQGLSNHPNDKQEALRETFL